MQSIAHEYHLVALQGDDEEVDTERLVIDGKQQHRANPKAGQPLIVGHPDGHAILGRSLV
jgi:hypothetical protein